MDNLINIEHCVILKKGCKVTIRLLLADSCPSARFDAHVGNVTDSRLLIGVIFITAEDSKRSIPVADLAAG